MTFSISVIIFPSSSSSHNRSRCFICCLITSVCETKVQVKGKSHTRKKSVCVFVHVADVRFYDAKALSHFNDNDNDVMSVNIHWIENAAVEESCCGNVSRRLWVSFLFLIQPLWTLSASHKRGWRYYQFLCHFSHSTCECVRMALILNK